jgi:methionyl aminopeptidase
MTIDSQNDVFGLKAIGAIVANTLQHMAASMKPGMTTKELDDIGRRYLASHGARSAPEITYDYPGATCISVNECVAHGIPDGTRIQPGDMVNIDVSAELNGYFGDTGASFLVPPSLPKQIAVCRATKKARNRAINQLRPGLPLNVIGKSIEKTARQFGMQIIRNLGSHGVGRALHEEPDGISSFYDKRDKRRLHDGLVITIEPFLSTGASMVTESRDGWSLMTPKGAFTAQYEHTVIITKKGPIITTLPTIS